jgi:hypothetical protein
MTRVRRSATGCSPARREGRIEAPPLAECLEVRRLLATLAVTTSADDGPGSLRQAILTGNGIPGADKIEFDIPAAPGTVQTIRLASPLPAAVGGLVTIDGRTQPGYAGRPLIELDGSGAGPGADGLTGPLAVLGLVVNRFGRHGIVLTGGAGLVGVGVQACYVGTTATGDAAAGNLGAGVYVTGNDTVIGRRESSAVDPAMFNVISGNGVGVWVAAEVRDATVTGNYIGTDVSGSRALPNMMEGVRVDSTVGETRVGGTIPGAGNLISGNGASGVKVGSRARATVQGNRIGTDASGTAAIPNGWSAIQSYQDGVTAVDAAQARVGGPSPQARNVISGNTASGVAVYGAATGNVEIQGNFIGTDAAGFAAVGNGGDGVLVLGPAPISPQAPRRSVLGNLISGNRRHGVHTSGVAATVAGNYIGTDAAGAAPLGNAGNGVDSAAASLNVGAPGLVTVTPLIDPAGTRRNIISGNAGHGVHGSGAAGFVISSYVGTDATGARSVANGGHGLMFEGRMPSVGTGYRESSEQGNVISGNVGHGILLRGVATNARDGRVDGNRIGTDASGARPLGNAGHGIAVIDSAGVVVGTETVTSTANTIAFNAGNGIRVEGADPSRQGQAATAAILRNSIFSNGRLGIDLIAPADDPSGVTPNDPADADRGPNGLQNFPVLISAAPVAGGTAVSMTIGTISNASVRVEVFSSPATDPSGHGEGRTFLASRIVATGNEGSVRLNLTVGAVRPGQWVTATTTWNNQTSEFSRAIRVGEAPTRRRFPYADVPAAAVTAPAARVALRPARVWNEASTPAP